ncbi:MAG: hypothetical protein ACJ76Y_30665 [Thermoanaerobaculia bacterium]
MPRRHATQAGRLGDLQILLAALAANGEDLPYLETSRAKKSPAPAFLRRARPRRPLPDAPGSGPRARGGRGGPPNSLNCLL